MHIEELPSNPDFPEQINVAELAAKVGRFVTDEANCNGMVYHEDIFESLGLVIGLFLSAIPAESSEECLKLISDSISRGVTQGIALEFPMAEMV